MIRITIALAALAGAVAPNALAKDAPTVISAEVRVDESDPTKRVISWTTAPAGAPVSLSVATDPQNAPTSGRPLADGVTGQTFTHGPKPGERLYYTVTPEGGDGVQAALRLLPLAGGRNFRDLGGYETIDGRRVKWGRLFRSCTMHALTDEDYALIKGLGVKTVVDFRATEERRDEPTQWRAGAVDTLNWDYGSADSSGELRKLFSKPGITPEDIATAMAGMYRGMVYEHGDKYAAMFDSIISSNAPLTFHCSAGKDRTGIAAALILSALEVPRETVLADYALSDKLVDYEAAFADPAEHDDASPYAFLSKMPRELVRPLLKSDPAYLSAALAQIEEDHGSVLTYIQTELGVDDTELAALRAQMLN